MEKGRVVLFGPRDEVIARLQAESQKAAASESAKTQQSAPEQTPPQSTNRSDAEEDTPQ